MLFLSWMIHDGAACIHIFLTIGSRITATSTSPHKDTTKMSVHFAQYFSS